MMRIGMMLLKLSCYIGRYNWLVLGIPVNYNFLYLFFGSGRVSVMMRLGVDVTEIRLCYIGHYN